MRSFRTTLALRVGLGALAGAGLLGLAAVVFLKDRLLDSLDESLIKLAELEAAYGADSLSAEFHFRSDHFRFPGAAGEEEPAFWAQLLSSDGIPLVLSANLAAPLPIPESGLAAANRGDLAIVTQQSQGTHGRGGPGVIPLRTVVYPMGRTGPAHADHRLQISTSLGPYQETIRGTGLLAAGMALGTALVAWLGTLVVAGRALTPALELTRGVESIGMNELGRRVAVPGHLAEFHRMAIAFNGLLDRVERAVTGTRRFTADASHELRAPLTVLRGELELARSRPRSPAELVEVLARCHDEVIRLSRLADDLLTLARVEGGAIGSTTSMVDLDEVVSRAVERKRPLAEAREVGVEVSGTAGPVQGDPDLLLRAMDGVVEHAIMASPDRGRVRVMLDSSDGTRTVRIMDGGGGLAPEEVPGLLDRFHRSRRARTRSSESGLALAIARAVAERHAGSFEYAGNHPGATFRMTLPASTRESDG